MAGDHQRPEREGRNLDRSLDGRGDSRHQLAQAEVFGVRDQIGLTGTDTAFCGGQESIDQIVDVDRVVVGLSRSEHREESLLDAAVDHQETLGIARSVDGRRPHDRELELVAAGIAGRDLAFVLGLLVVVLWSDRRRFVSGGRCDMTVDPLGTAVDELPGSGEPSFFCHDSRALDVHVAI